MYVEASFYGFEVGENGDLIVNPGRKVDLYSAYDKPFHIRQNTNNEMRKLIITCGKGGNIEKMRVDAHIHIKNILNFEQNDEIPKNYGINVIVLTKLFPNLSECRFKHIIIISDVPTLIGNALCNSHFSSIDLSRMTTVFGYLALNNCINASSIKFPEKILISESTGENAGLGLLSNCHNLKDISFRHCRFCQEYIFNNMFENCYSLKRIVEFPGIKKRDHLSLNNIFHNAKSLRKDDKTKVLHRFQNVGRIVSCNFDSVQMIIENNTQPPEVLNINAKNINQERIHFPAINIREITLSFSSNYSVRNIDLSQVSGVFNLDRSFENCICLIEILFPEHIWVCRFNKTFRGCVNLKRLHKTNQPLSISCQHDIIISHTIFENCPKLTCNLLIIGSSGLEKGFIQDQKIQITLINDMIDEEDGDDMIDEEDENEMIEEEDGDDIIEEEDENEMINEEDENEMIDDPEEMFNSSLDESQYDHNDDFSSQEIIPASEEIITFEEEKKLVFDEDIVEELVFKVIPRPKEKKALPDNLEEEIYFSSHRPKHRVRQQYLD